MGLRTCLDSALRDGPRSAEGANPLKKDFFLTLQCESNIIREWHSQAEPRNRESKGPNGAAS